VSGAVTAPAYVTRLAGDTPLEIEQEDGVFRPTHTSELFIAAARKRLTAPVRILDLGCGSGVVGIALARLGLVAAPLCASDVSESAVALSRRNAARHDVAIDARVGSLFSPWAGSRFTCIVDDVSGIAEDVARLSPWFGDAIPCASGPDGTELTRAVLETAGRHLEPGGTLLVPAISLSHVARLLETAGARFASVEKVAEQRWPLPAEMVPHLDTLRAIRDEGRITFEEKFGMVLCTTTVYACRDPRESMA
jgi:release factor glutamine methyltransferase